MVAIVLGRNFILEERASWKKSWVINAFCMLRYPYSCELGEKLNFRFLACDGRQSMCWEMAAKYAQNNAKGDEFGEMIERRQRSLGTTNTVTECLGRMEKIWRCKQIFVLVEVNEGKDVLH